MTDDELIEDLARLLREGLAACEADDDDVPRFAITQHGVAELAIGADDGHTRTADRQSELGPWALVD